MSSLVLATIDSDISNIPENEFAPVFVGGILVMLGGLLSTVFVGLVVDKKDLYTNIVADSYLQSSDDEEFWKGLSEEERIKTQELLTRMKSSKGGSGGGAGQETPSAVTANGGDKSGIEQQVEAAAESIIGERNKATVAPQTAAAAADEPVEADSRKKTEIGMFSDYADDS